MEETALPPETVSRLQGIFKSEQEALIGRLAVRRGLITEDQLKEVLEAQAQGEDPGGDGTVFHRPLGALLVSRKWIDTATLASLLDDQRREQVIRLSTVKTDDVPLEVQPFLGDPSRDVAGFILVEQLGRGASGEVWKAWDRKLRRWVAVKKPGAPLQSPLALERFRREAQAAARLTHQNIVSMYQVGEQDGRPYIVMQLVEGRSLAETRVPLRRALEIVRCAAMAADYAHHRGVVHRDLKPGNIMIDLQGGVWVLDFGVAHLLEADRTITAAGTIIGTPAYMSPEAARGDERAREPASDVYSLGATLYELATGHIPFTGDSFAQVVRRVIEEEPVAPRLLNSRLPRDVETIILRAMDKEPHRRYESAADLAEDLRRYLDGEPIVARSTTLGYRLYRRVRKNPLTYALGTVAVAAVVAALAVWLTSMEKARRLQLDMLRAEAEKSSREKEQIREQARLQSDKDKEHARYEAERDAALRMMRTTASSCVESALRLRRGGYNEGMEALVPLLLQAYEGAKGAAPEHAEVEYWMGRMKRVLMQDTEALQFQERALEKNPDFPPALYERILLNSRRYGNEVQKAFESLRSRGAHAHNFEDFHRENPEAGRLWKSINDDSDRLDRLIREGRDSPVPISEANLLEIRGMRALYSRNFQEAFRLLSDAVEREPQMEEAWEDLARTVCQRAAWETDPLNRAALWKEAKECCTRGLDRDRGYVPLWLYRAEAFMDSGTVAKSGGGDPTKDFASGESDLNEAIRLSPREAKAFQLRGSIRLNRSAYRLSRNEDPNSDFDSALEDFTRALKFKEDFPIAWCNRSLLHLNRGIFKETRGSDPLSEYEQAESDMKRGIQLHTSDPEYWYWLGMIHQRQGDFHAKLLKDPMGDYSNAESDVTEALRLDPNTNRADPFRLRGITRWSMGQQLQTKGDGPGAKKAFAGAADDFAGAIRRNPSLSGKLEPLRKDAENRAKSE